MSVSKSLYTVVVTYNASPFIERCLQSLVDSEYPTQIIVVDNNSDDHTVDLVRSFPEVQLIINKKNLGFGKANNIGISRALQDGAEFVFLLNQDAFIAKDALGQLMSIAEQNSEYGLLSPIHFNGTGDNLDPKFAIYIAMGASQLYADGLLGKPLSKLYSTTHFLNAAAWFLSKKCLLEVGGFDPLFFMYGEDDDLFRRIRLHEFRVGIVSTAKIYHLREKSLAAKTPHNRIAKLNSSNNLVYSQHVLTLKSRGLKSWLALSTIRITNHVIRLNLGKLTKEFFTISIIISRMPKILRCRQLSGMQPVHWSSLKKHDWY